MFVPFESLPAHARLWIYQSTRKLSSSEQDIISNELTSFTTQWEVHGQPMKTSFTILYNQFLILAADEGYNAASGCSIDGSVRVLKKLGEQINIDFLNRSTVAFKGIEEDILLVPVAGLKQKSAEGLWGKNTLVFNNLISTKGDMDKNWLLPAGDTWLKRYLVHETLTN